MSSPPSTVQFSSPGNGGNGTEPSPIGSPLGTTNGVQDYTDQGEAVVIVTVIMTIVTTLIVALRMAARFFVLRLRGTDDWLILAAMTVTIANVICIVIGVKYGTGRHESTLPIAESEVAVKYRLVSHLLYTAATVLVKASLLMLYLRLFPALRWAIIGTMTFVVAMGVAFILGASFRCNPIGAAWNPWKYELNSFTCFPALPFWIAFGALFLASDIIVLVLPMRTILGLHISRQKKTILVCLLSLGAFACVAGIVRLVYVIRLYTTEDASWNTAFVSIASTIEICSAIIAASIPPTKVFVDRFFPNLIDSTRNATSYWQQRRLESVELSSNVDRHQRNPTDNVIHSSRLRSGSKSQPSITVTRDFDIDVSSSPAGSVDPIYHEPPPYQARDLKKEYSG